MQKERERIRFFVMLVRERERERERGIKTTLFIVIIHRTSQDDVVCCFFTITPSPHHQHQHHTFSLSLTFANFLSPLHNAPTICSEFEYPLLQPGSAPGGALTQILIKVFDAATK
jgi:hypothetical protein